MVDYSEETTSDAVVKASSQNQEEQFNDFEDERENNLFPSRKIAKLLREKIFLVLRVVWRQFELYGWYFLFALLVYVTFKRQIRGFCRTLWSSTAGRLLERTRTRFLEKKSSISEKDREKQLERARRKQEEEWEKASKERLTSKTNADKRIEAVEKKASRLGVAKHRKGHVLGRE